MPIGTEAARRGAPNSRVSKPVQSAPATATPSLARLALGAAFGVVLLGSLGFQEKYCKVPQACWSASCYSNSFTQISRTYRIAGPHKWGGPRASPRYESYGPISAHACSEPG